MVIFSKLAGKVVNLPISSLHGPNSAEKTIPCSPAQGVVYCTGGRLTRLGEAAALAGGASA